MKRTAIDIIRQISLEVEHRNLPLEVMVRDLQLMKFKIRSLIGDISFLETENHNLVTSLWKIGKIDEIVSSSLHELEEEEQEALIKYFNGIEARIQDNIRASLRLKDFSDESSVLKLEIFKDMSDDSVLN